MITSSSIPYITRMLSEPGLLTEMDRDSVAAMIKEFPYFALARYMDAAIEYRKNPHRGEIASRVLPYMGNWLLFNDLLDKATAKSTSGGPKVTDLTGIAADENNNEPNKRHTNQEGDQLIMPVYTDNYFFHQGINVPDGIPEEMDHAEKPEPEITNDKDKSLLVMMSFSEWLLHYKTKTQKEIEEQEEKRALKSMWQQEKLAAANEEENEEIPEDVFNMAVNSITKEEDLASEALAQIHRKQGRPDRAIEMYRKLSLRNPQKIAYFAHKIEELLKEKEL